jgi:hypothetical protein
LLEFFGACFQNIDSGHASNSLTDSFARGTKGQSFILHRFLWKLPTDCSKRMSDIPSFCIRTCHFCLKGFGEMTEPQE